MQKFHYVYKITNHSPIDERQFYIGVRTSKVDPEKDNYRGSSKYLKEAFKQIGHDHFSKEILSIWPDRKLALKEEIRLHKLYDVGINPMFYNKSIQTSTGFDTSGIATQKDKVAAIDENGKNVQVSKEEYYNNPKLKSVKSGKVNVVDLRDGKRKEVTKENFDKYDYYVSYLKNMVTVKDIRTGESLVVPKEIYRKYDYYVSLNKNRVNVIDLRDNSTKQVSREELQSNEHYIMISCKHYQIYDETGKLIYEITGPFKKFCEENKLPHQALMDSYKQNGKPLYQHHRARIRKGFEKYKGWYAIQENII